MNKMLSPINFSDTWSLTRDAFLFLSRDKRLNIFPFISACLLCLLFAATLMSLPLFLETKDYVVAAVLYLFVIYIVGLNNYALTAMTLCKLRRQPISTPSAFKLALLATPRIMVYTLFIALFSVPGKLIENTQTIIEKLIGRSFSYSWSTATFFLLPIMVTKNVGVFSAAQQSMTAIGKGWRSTVQVKTLLAIVLIVFLLVISEFLPFYPLTMTHFLIASLPFFVLTILLATTLEVIVSCAIYLNLVQLQPLKNFDNSIFNRVFVKED